MKGYTTPMGLPRSAQTKEDHVFTFSEEERFFLLLWLGCRLTVQ